MDQSPTLFEKKSFGGSFTDNVYSNDLALCARSDNFLVNNNEKLYVRPGSTTVYPSVNTLYSTGYKLNKFLKFRDDSQIFVGVGPNLYRDTGSGWTALTGPSSGVAFNASTDSHYWSYAEWGGHLFICNSKTSSKPIKVYKDSGSTWRLRTAGLPEVPKTANYVSATLLASAIVLANYARSALLTHYANTSAHPQAHTAATNALTVSAATDLATLKTLVAQLLTSYKLHIDDIISTGAFHYGEEPSIDYNNNYIAPRASEESYTLASTKAPETLLECVIRLNDIKAKVLSHWSQVDRHFSTTTEYATSFYTQDFLFDNAEGPGIFLNKSSIYTYANTCKSKFNTHIAYASGGYLAFSHATADATNTITSASATTAATLRNLTYEIYTDYYGHQVDAELGSTFFHAQASNSAHPTAPKLTGLTIGNPPYPDLYGGVESGNFKDTLTRLNEFKNKFNAHVKDGIYTAFSGTHPHDLPVSSEKNTFLVPGDDIGLANYLYGFCWKYEYTVGDLTFVDRGPIQLVVPNVGAVTSETDVDEVRGSSTISIEYEGQSITNLPSFVSVTGDNYDTSNIYLEIYRTINNGNVLYKVDEVVNGTTSYTDRVKDAELQQREKAYTTGGVLNNDPPPRAKCIHIVNEKAYYGNLVITNSDGVDESYPNQVRESLALDPDSVPNGSTADMLDAVVGISSFKSVPIVFGSGSHHRLEGGYDDLGRGGLVPQIISESVGCLSEASIVRTEFGVFFAGTDGFYVTDGYQTTKISKDWNTTYLSYTASSTQKANIYGDYNPHQLRIWWGMTTSGSTNDVCVVLDLNYPLSPTPTWTTCSGGDSWKPSALLFANRTLYRGDSRGYIFTHLDTNQKVDPFVNTSLAPSSWGTQAIIWDFQSTLMDFGSGVMRKWAPWLHAQFHTSGNSFYCEPQTRVEATENSWSSLSRMEKNNSIFWGDPFIQWGDSSFVWNETPSNFVAIKRAFPATSLRFTHKQVRFKLPYLLAHDSTVNVGESASVLNTTVTVSGVTWNSAIISWYISFSNDNYATSYQILDTPTSTTATISSAPTTGSGLSFKIYGYPKNVKFELLDYQISGNPIDKTQEGSRSWQS